MTDNELSKKEKFRQETKEERKIRFKDRRRKKAELKLVGFRQSTNYIDSTLTNESIYYIDPQSNKLRKVYPYFFTWITYAKERWYGRTIEDVFQYEFRRAILKQNFNDIIRNGLVRINGQCIEKDYIMKNGDKLEHFTHRHEVPVINEKFKILINNEDYLVIDKPCSIPVHPCGKYRFNTVLAILHYEYQLSNLRTVHRLDRMTSGILIMAKSAAKARAIDFNADRSSANGVDKLYLCRVRGEFPYKNQIVRVDKPIETFSFQLGLTKIGGNKQCQTLFRYITFEELKQQENNYGKFIFDLNNDNNEIIIDQSLYKYSDQDQTKTSLVLCRPLSGRMHQIRVHLQYLGFPIINDPLYNAPDIWGPSNGQYGQYEYSNEYVIETFIKRHSCEYWLLNDIDNEDETINLNGKRVIEQDEEQINDDTKRMKTEEEETTTIDVNDDNAVKTYIKEHCFECLNRFREPAPDDLVMFLHALQSTTSLVGLFTDQNWNILLASVVQLQLPEKSQVSDLYKLLRKKKMMRKKVLLMGKSGGGKTSMRSIIFANYSAKDTRRLGATMDVEQSYVRFLGNLILNLWDCGGQEAFMECYFAAQKDNIFKNVEVLIYVFDVQSQELDKDLHYYQSCLESILQHSSQAKIFCLVHKMDLVPEDMRENVFAERQNILINLSKPLQCSCFRTSIWDETLYKAWSQIVYQLVPNVKGLEKTLTNFAEIIDADEILLFEKATFLVISHCTRKPHRDARRFEKISDIIKQFKLSCSKLTAAFQSMEVRNSTFACFIELLTPNTYVMVVISDPSISSEVTLMNIRNARKVFEKLEKDVARN